MDLHEQFEALSAEDLRPIALSLSRRLDAMERELAALRLVYTEALELVGEADASATIPAANIEALRALLWRATLCRQPN